MNIGIIILAAGSSTRMGQSKQLLKVQDDVLIVHAAKTALATGMTPVVVVLGADEKEHRLALNDINVEIVDNANWSRGMGSSLKAGLSHLEKKGHVHAAVVMVCDQPMLPAAHLKELAAQYESTHKRIVASYYAGTAGVPALFDQFLFGEIHDLPDEEGAKKIIMKHPNDTIAIAFPEGAIDLDTPEDYKKFKGKK
jgi:molybdenum cofactor cytidylyltransferase